MLTHVRHTGLVVENVEKAAEFYKALGFVEVSRDIEQGVFIEQVTGIPGACLEWIKLTLDGTVLLELLQYHTPGNAHFDMKFPDTAANRYAPNLHGCSHIAYSTNDASECCKMIEQLGGHVVNLPALSPNGKVLVAYAYDLDGILLEIVQELPMENISG